MYSTLLVALLVISCASANDQVLKYSFTGVTTDASLNESGSFSFGTEDAFDIKSTFLCSSSGGTFSNTEFHLDDVFVGVSDLPVQPGSAGEKSQAAYDGVDFKSTTSKVDIRQDLEYGRNLTTPVKMCFHNTFNLAGGNSDVVAHLVGTPQVADIGVESSVYNGERLAFDGHVVDASFTPKMEGTLKGKLLLGEILYTNRFSFNRDSQIYGAETKLQHADRDWWYYEHLYN